jgi:hypothetical protein
MAAMPFNRLTGGYTLAELNGRPGLALLFYSYVFVLFFSFQKTFINSKHIKRHNIIKLLHPYKASYLKKHNCTTVLPYLNYGFNSSRSLVPPTSSSDMKAMMTKSKTMHTLILEATVLDTDQGSPLVRQHRRWNNLTTLQSHEATITTWRFNRSEWKDSRSG